MLDVVCSTNDINTGQNKSYMLNACFACGGLNNSSNRIGRISPLNVTENLFYFSFKSYWVSQP